MKSTNGADELVKALNKLGVKVVFCISGAGNLAIIDALFRDGKIKLVYSHHEQAAVMEAQGYARVSGEIGVALVTTGGGTSNTLTGVLSAYLDSIPILLISGNESSFHCENEHNLRAYGVQGFDSVKALGGVVKHSHRVMNVNEIHEYVTLFSELALENRMGPVHLDIPMDLQRAKVDRNEQLETARSFSAKKDELKQPIDITELVTQISSSNAPILYIGNGCRNEIVLSKLAAVINELQIPYVLSWSAIDLFPDSDPLNIGRVGIYGDRAANILLQRADLLIAVGTRLSIPQCGYDKSDFARKAVKWIIEIDKSECNKFDGLGWNVLNCSSEDFSQRLYENRTEIIEKRTSNWINLIQKTKKAFPRVQESIDSQVIRSGTLHSVSAVEVINRNKLKNSIIVTDVGAGLLSGHYAAEIKKGDRFFTSQGLGEMGFGLPAAIGAYFADPDRQIICLNTDGAIMFNLQELQLVKEYSIPLKLFIFNNNGYGMIRISQSNLFDNRLSGSTTETGLSFPDFRLLAMTFGLNYCAVKSMEEMESIFDLINDSDTAILVEVLMDSDQRYLPRLGTSKSKTGDLISPPLEDLDPLIGITELEKHLGYTPHENSYKVRNLEKPSA
jgi:acetolactate synthase-1/2/3 large subunit